MIVDISELNELIVESTDLLRVIRDKSLDVSLNLSDLVQDGVKTKSEISAAIFRADMHLKSNENRKEAECVLFNNQHLLRILMYSGNDLSYDDLSNKASHKDVSEKIHDITKRSLAAIKST